jgi:hypothetical protein
MIKKYMLVGCLMLGSASRSVKALTTVETEKIFDLTSCIALWQNTFLAVFGNKMHKQCPAGTPETTNYRDPAVLFGNALQLPRDIVGAALEKPKSFIGQSMQAAAIARLAADKLVPSVLESLFDSAVFNAVNVLVLHCCPAAEWQSLRRITRIVNMAMVRYGVLLFTQGIISSTRSVNDNAQSVAHKDALAAQAATCFYAKTLYHIFTECAGAVVKGMIDDTPAGDEQIAAAAVLAVVGDEVDIA